MVSRVIQFPFSARLRRKTVVIYEDRKRGHKLTATIKPDGELEVEGIHHLFDRLEVKAEENGSSLDEYLKELAHSVFAKEVRNPKR